MSALRGLSSAKQAALERALRGGGNVRKPDTIRPRPADAVVPISVEQEHVWLHATMAADVPLYNEAITIHRHGPCNPDLLEASLNEVMRRHEIWRTSFTAGSHGIVQRVHEGLRLRLPLADLSGLSPPEREAAALQIATREARLPFDLSEAPLLRGTIVKLSDFEHRLYLSLHHIIFDGVSIYHVLLPTLTAIYADLVAGTSPTEAGPAKPALQYADYTLWRAAQLESDAIARQLAYWSETLAGELPVLALPSDHPAPRPPTYRGDMATFALSAGLTRRLKRTSLELGITPYALLLAGFQTLLFRYTGQTDLIVGAVVDMRRHRAIEPLMGYFLNSLPIRTRPAPGMSFRDYARQTSSAVVDMIAAGDVPFSRLVHTLQPRRSAVSHPLFQVLFSIEPPAPQFAGGWDLTQMDVPVGSAKFDLYLELDERPEGLIGRFLYSTDLFEPSTIQGMIGHWCSLIEAAVADPACALENLQLLTPDETARMAGWNDTAQAVPDTSLDALFETQARCTPDALAVVSAERSYTYRDLDQQVARVAAWLRRAGVRPGMLVGVCLERSVDMIAALLATLKAGAAYMPLDPALPTARLASFLDVGAVTILLTRSHLLAELPRLARVLLLDDLADAEVDSAPLPPQSAPDDLAYVLCTSGTTGRPKAVEITHRAVVNLLMAMQHEPGFTAADSLLAITTVSFDIAALELFLPLVSGGRVILADRDTAADPFRLAEQIRQMRPTVMQATPSTWRALIDAGWAGSPGLTILAGGEALPRDLADALLRRADSVWNMYGPTETTIWSTAHRVQAGDGAVPIGRPIANTAAFVLDPCGHQLPVGVPGELYLGGVGVARGYRNQNALTLERFSRPAATFGQRTYRTGDIVKLRADGTLEWVGRNDDQTKIRGHRVELSEVEAALTALPGVRNAAVVTHSGAGGFIQLVAHVVAPDCQIMPLRADLARRLPDYMVPASFVFHDALPLSSNGKLDRRQLPAPRHTALGNTKPRTEIERRLGGLWKELLGLDEIELAADFFALGGHSLLAIRLLVAIEAEFGRRISALTLYQSPTIESLAAVIEGGGAGDQLTRVGGLNPVVKPKSAIFDARDATKLRLLRRARGHSRGSVVGMPGYVGHATEIGIIAANALEDYDVWTFAVDTNGRKLAEDGAWLACAQEIAGRLAAKDGLRPRAFIGFSLGGFMAWLVERLLVAAGGEATPIINFDGSAWHVDNEEFEDPLKYLLPPIHSPKRPTMLLLHRQSPGKFELDGRSDSQWARAGVNIKKLSYRTVNHLDVVSPAAIAASRGALAAFIETGSIDLAPEPIELSFDTVGGSLFRVLNSSACPDTDSIRTIAEGTTLPKEGNVRIALLLLAAATGDAEMAFALARRMTTEEPGHRAATYLQVALLSQSGRTEEALVLAENWCHINPWDRSMLARAKRAQRRPAAWGLIEGLVIGSDESLDFAVRSVQSRHQRASATAVSTVTRSRFPCPANAAGNVESLSYCSSLGGWLILGWIGFGWDHDDAPCEALLNFGCEVKASEPIVCVFDREDVREIGTGAVIFLPIERDAHGTPQDITLRRGSYSFSAGLGSTQMVDAATGEAHARNLLTHAERSEHWKTLVQMLGKPVFTGEDTIDRFKRPFFLHIDFAYLCPPFGLVLLGWMVDHFDITLEMTVRCGCQSARLDLQQMIHVPRPDVRDLFAEKFGEVTLECGFIAYLPDVYVPGEPPYVEVETIYGELGFKTMAAVRSAGPEVVKNILAGFDLRYNQVVNGYDRVIGPVIEAINGSCHRNHVSYTHLTFGRRPQPAPRASIIVPLHVQTDLMKRQLAFFSKTLSKDHELIFVLDDPAKLQATEVLAASCLARFQHPFSLVVAAENVDSASAKNIGLAVAVGSFSCFLSNGVVPDEPRWLDYMLETAGADPLIGLVGAVLIFDDDTLQQEVANYETLPKMGGWVFCTHPSKGLVLQDQAAVTGVETVTGACFLMPTDLARTIDGFDKGYLIGEFEDADLCEKVKLEARVCVVDRRARLYNIERQLEIGPRKLWNRNAELYNAWRFQRRWADASPRSLLYDSERSAVQVFAHVAGSAAP